MELRVLNYFLTIIDAGSISLAAEQLHLTQPTISRQIKALEAELGQALFIRHQNGPIELTSAGQLLKDRAQELISLATKTTQEFHQLTDVITGDVYLGGGESYLFKHLAQVVAQLQHDYPHIHYHLTSGNAPDVQRLLDQGLLDFAIVSHPRQLPAYEYLKLPYHDTWGVIVPNDHPLANHSNIHRDELTAYPLILSRQAITNRDSDNQFRNWMGNLNDFEIISTFNLISNSLYLVEAKVGVMIAFANMINHPKLTFIPLDPTVTATQYVIWKRGKVLSPASQLFIDALKKAVK